MPAETVTDRKSLDEAREPLLAAAQMTRADVEGARVLMSDILERISDGFVAFDAQMNYTYVNARAGELLGRAPADLIGKNYWTEYPEARGTPFANAYGRALETQAPTRLEDYYAPWDRWFENRIYPSTDGLSIFFSDVTASKQREIEFARQHRALRMLSQCNQAILRARAESELLNEVCRVIVETGGYLMAWVGYAEQDEGKSVRPVAQMGFEQGYLDTVNITWADAERGRGPTGTAIRTAAPVIARNIPGDPNYAPWRAAAIQRGYASSIALPLLPPSPGRRGAGGEVGVLGALNIYAAAPDAFDDDEVSLLTELAGDLAYGIAALRTRAERERAEEALRESEARFKAIAANTPDHILMQDRALRYTFVVNPQLGLTEQDMLGKSDYDFLPKEEADQLTQVKTQVMETGEAVHFETSLISKSGEAEFFDGSYVPRRDAQGQVEGLIGYFRNVTDRKRAEEALRESETRHRNVVELSFDAIAVHSEGRIISINPAGAQLFGTDDPAQFIGKPMLDFVHLDYHEIALARASQAITQGSGAALIEEKFLRLDGSVIDVEVAGFPIVYQGKPAMQAVIRDITERKRAEEALRQSEEKFNRAFHSSPDAITITRAADGLLVEVNPSFERISGYSAAEVIGRSSVALDFWADPQDRDRYVAALRDQGRVTEFETRLRTKSGEMRSFVLSGEIYQIQSEYYILGILRDITERRRAEEEIRQLNMELEQRVTERTAELRRVVNLMAGREVRMAELKEVIRQLQAQLRAAGLPSAVQDPLQAYA